MLLKPGFCTVYPKHPQGKGADGIFCSMEHFDGDIAQLRKEHDFGVREIAKSCWDVKYGVAQTCAFIKLITLEGQTLCVELSGKGYRVTPSYLCLCVFLAFLTMLAS